MNNADERKLRHAINMNDISTASALFQSGIGKDKAWPLMNAACRGNVEMMAMLLDAGADIDASNESHRTACHGAIGNKRFDALKLLIDRGANVNVCRWTPGESLLRAASRLDYCDERIVNLLLDANAPLNDLSPTMIMALVAVTWSVNVFHRLLARNVDVSALRDREGNTLSHLVVWNARHDGVHDELMRELVVVGGIDVNAVNNVDVTPFHYAAMNRNAHAMRTLVELGADVDLHCEALHRLCCSDWLDDAPCAELLVALGADVRLANNQGITACHLAASHRNHQSALALLLAAGADLDAPNDNGETPRTIAFRERCPLPPDDDIVAARRRISKLRLDFVRHRALDICVGLQPLNLDALQLCNVLANACGVFASLIAFHQWWKIATTVKHFRDRVERNEKL